MIRVMVAEDERLAREELIYLLQQEEGLVLCPSAETGEQLLELYEKYKPDVVFLDIQMPKMSGVHVAKEIFKKEKIPPLFIFTTAYDDYAVDAFEVEAVDYLLKPYDQERLKQAIKRVVRRLNQEAAQKEKSRGSVNSKTKSKLLIDDGERVVVLSPDTICYATRVERVVEIHTKDELFHGRMTLQELEDRLKGYPFFRPHRSYLVNLDYIQEIKPWFNGAYNLILKDGKETSIPVSRHAQKKLFQILEE
ncbi:LytTR family DNA-binding domain-containing protein [Siminovitchia sp. FSL H7-0308]|uniref:Two-component system response regulator LytT n=1 Tax=Siminovitchia thermophila TaxID=1245522 RepID=A0ABS2RCS8_9BACI|nr:LytTR family DNA-binding domain-containing protein [Siminovitchia thermophila]MBM7717462.1 two-component system response regulator LytT [Siminovitchia thermophila]ONK22316.1 DNA-binding response regulator [Bacillus sp. VT-16-64]